MLDYALEYDRMVYQSNKQQELIERQHEAIVKLREALTELGGMYVVHHNAVTRAKQVLKDTEDLK